MRTLIALTIVTSLLTQVVPREFRATFAASRGLSGWDLDGNGVWKMHDGFLALEEAGVPGGPIRRPAAIAIAQTEPFTDFRLDVDVRSTAPVDLAVRDVLLIFGYRSPTEFYYVHLAAKTDAVHNGIFLVNRVDRKRLDEPTSTAKLTDQAWHHLRLDRDSTSGSIQIFFDSDTTPMLSVIDKTLTSGRVGIGSFDETGEFRNFQITGR